MELTSRNQGLKWDNQTRSKFQDQCWIFSWISWIKSLNNIWRVPFWSWRTHFKSFWFWWAWFWTRFRSKTFTKIYQEKLPMLAILCWKYSMKMTIRISFFLKFFVKLNQWFVVKTSRMWIYWEIICEFSYLANFLWSLSMYIVSNKIKMNYALSNMYQLIYFISRSFKWVQSKKCALDLVVKFK